MYRLWIYMHAWAIQSLNTPTHKYTEKWLEKIYTKMLTMVFFPLDGNIMVDNFLHVFNFLISKIYLDYIGKTHSKSIKAL